jgi:hypothetical protein
MPVRSGEAALVMSVKVRRFSVIYSYGRNGWIVWDRKIKRPVKQDAHPRTVWVFESGQDAAQWLKDRPEKDAEEIPESEAGTDPWRRKSGEEPRRYGLR